MTDVKYTLENAKVCVEVWARVGEYNQHREYLRSKAEFEKLIDWHNKFEPDFLTEKKLKEIYHESSPSTTTILLRRSYFEEDIRDSLHEILRRRYVAPGEHKTGTQLDSGT